VYGAFAAWTLVWVATGVRLRAAWLAAWPETDKANPVTAINVIALSMTGFRISTAPRAERMEQF
jgi:hypothetical protein